MSDKHTKVNYHANEIDHHIERLSKHISCPEDLRAERFHSQMDGALEIMREGLRLFCHYSEGYFEVNDAK